MKRTRSTIHLNQLSSPLRDVMIALATLVFTSWLISVQLPKAGFLIVPVAIVVGAAPLFALLQNRRARHEIPTLGTLETLSEEIGVSAEVLETFALEQGIVPQYRVGDMNYFKPADFSDSARLLRPSSKTAGLLRPTEIGPSATELLIPVEHSD